MNHPQEIQNWRCALTKCNPNFMSLEKNNELQNHVLCTRENCECPRA